MEGTKLTDELLTISNLLVFSVKIISSIHGINTPESRHPPGIQIIELPENKKV